MHIRSRSMGRIVVEPIIFIPSIAYTKLTAEQAQAAFNSLMRFI